MLRVRFDEHDAFAIADCVNEHITESNLHRRVDVKLGLLNCEDSTRAVWWAGIQRTNNNGNHLRNTHTDIRGIDIDIGYLIVQLKNAPSWEPLQGIENPLTEEIGISFVVL